MRNPPLLHLLVPCILLTGCIDSLTEVSSNCEPVRSEVAEVRGDTIVTTSGLRYIEIEPGAVLTADNCEQMAVQFAAFFPDGTRWGGTEQGEVLTFTLGLTDLIAGFEQGVLGMQLNGRRRLIVPPELGYGSEGLRNPQTGEVLVPPNSTLIYDVELVGVER